jgi:F-type H+-transporting ATPase subunit epsilon
MEFRLTTCEKVVEKNTIEWAILPGKDGDIQVFPDHAPLLQGLRAGTLIISLHDEKREKHFFIFGGLSLIQGHALSVFTTRIIVLADGRLETLDHALKNFDYGAATHARFY